MQKVMSVAPATLDDLAGPGDDDTDAGAESDTETDELRATVKGESTNGPVPCVLEKYKQFLKTSRNRFRV